MMFYVVARSVCRGILKVLRRWEIHGRENMPAEGGIVIVANHNSLWDPVIVGCAFDRNVRYMAKEELYQVNPMFTWLLRKLLTFPVKRGQADRAALKHALEILKGGGIIGLFPEGSRSKSGDIQEARNGAAMLAIKSGAAILPVGVKGAKGWGRVEVYVGKPISTAQFADQKINKELLSTFSQEFMKEIEELVK